MMSLVKIIDISGSLSACQCEECHIVVATPILMSRTGSRRVNCTHNHGCNFLLNPAHNLSKHLLIVKLFYGNFIVTRVRIKSGKCYLEKRINVKPHFRNGSSLDDIHRNSKPTTSS